MASLAILAALVIFSAWILAGGAVCLSLFGLRFIGGVLGAVSVAVGIFLLCALPLVPFLGVLNLACGGFAIIRFFRNGGG